MSERTSRPPLSHLDPSGGVRMVDVGGKDLTAREAVARGRVKMQRETLDMIARGEMPKGDVLAAAQVAGIMAAKRTPDLVPLCHPLALAGVDVRLHLDRRSSAVEVEAAVRAEAKTGAEMEALTAVSVACLTVYDMCKAVQKDMVISDVRVVSKSGGKSGVYLREGERIG